MSSSRSRRRWLCLALGTFFATTASGCDRAGPRATEEPDGACSMQTSASALDYVPSDAVAMVSVQIDELVRFEQDTLGTDVIRDTGYDEILDSLAACGLGIDTFRAVHVAYSEDEVIVAIEGRGLGDESRLRCLQGEVGRGRYGESWGVRRRGCDVRIERDGETVGFVASPDVVIYATKGWLGHARAISLGARPHPPRHLVRRAGGKSVAFGGDLRPYREEIAAWPLVGGLQTVRGFIDLDAGFEFEIEGTYASREFADATAQELEALRRRARLLGPELGIPTKVFDRIQIRQRGRRVQFGVSLTRKDVRRIGEAVRHDGASRDVAALGSPRG